jgi:hypothetical protein
MGFGLAQSKKNTMKKPKYVKFDNETQVVEFVIDNLEKEIEYYRFWLREAEYSKQYIAHASYMNDMQIKGAYSNGTLDYMDDFVQLKTIEKLSKKQDNFRLNAKNMARLVAAEMLLKEFNDKLFYLKKATQNG